MYISTNKKKPVELTQISVGVWDEVASVVSFRVVISQSDAGVSTRTPHPAGRLRYNLTVNNRAAKFTQTFGPFGFC